MTERGIFMSSNRKKKFLIFDRIIFYFISFTWGLPASFIGLLIMIPFLIIGKVKTFSGRLYGIFPKFFGDNWGFEMGCFYFVANNEKNICEMNIGLHRHECGHGIQNIIFGPLMLFIVSIPSVIRYWYRKIKIKNGKGSTLKSYDSIWFEAQADYYGSKYIY